MSSIGHLLEYAVSVGASDIHLVVNQRPILRQYGEIIDGGKHVLNREVLEKLVDELMPDHARSSFGQEHEADFSIDEPGVGRFRVNVFVAQGVPSFSLRLVQTSVPTFEQLWLPDVLKGLALSASGILLAGGSSGAGKSTTLARMIEHINENMSRRIITIEDPIEFLFTNNRSLILQREIGIDTMSFAAALKHVYRQDPDVVMIGEMRDAESFSAALSMAETGHFVMSTLHIDTARQAVTRILNFFPQAERDIIRTSLAVNLRGVVCQRLIKDVDEHLVPAVEILVNTPLVRKAIESNLLDKLPAAIETDQESGMQNFNQSLHELIKIGKITEDIALENSTSPESLRMILSGINLGESKRIISD